MFYRVLAALIAVALIYITYEVIATQRHYKLLLTPSAPFMAMNYESGEIPVVQYIDLRCAECKKAVLVMMDYAEENPDVLYILRPIHRGDETGYNEARTVIASGAQKRYFETMRLIASYEGNPDEQFYRDNASLLDLDIDQLQKDLNSGEIGEIMQKNDLAIARSGLKSTQALMAGRKLYYLEGPLSEDDIAGMVEAERQKR